jgi:hypothetical protein
MGVGWTIIPNDWIQLERVINELGSRILDEQKALSSYLLADGSRDLTGDWVIALKNISLIAGTLSAFRVTGENVTSGENPGHTHTDGSGGSIAPQAGSFSITDQTVVKDSSYTVEIPLSHTNFTMGQMIIYLPSSVTYSNNKRMTSFIMFTTDINNALARSSGRTHYSLYGYNFTDFWVKGFAYADDSKLSDNYFGATGRWLRIESCQIVADKIELVFKNPNATYDAVLTCEGRYIVN